MDIPRQRPKPTWRDTPWWQATRQSLISGILMIAIAAPIIAWLGSSLMHLANMTFSPSLFLSELGKGSLAMMPYLWCYYFALEWISRGRNNGYSAQP
jgi:hypothetical protein